MFVLFLCGIMVVCENKTKSSNNNLSGALNTNISVFVKNTSMEPSGPLGFKTKRAEYKLPSIQQTVKANESADLQPPWRKNLFPELAKYAVPSYSHLHSSIRRLI